MGRLSLGIGGVEAQLVDDIASDLEMMEGGATVRRLENKRFIRMAQSLSVGSM